MNALKILVVLILVLLVTAAVQADSPKKVVLVIHGGAGVVPRAQMTPELEKQYREDLTRSLQAGYDALRKGTSVDAVEAAIEVMEETSRFNAGKGAVFDHDGRNELDASIMQGKDRTAGAVAGVTRIKNPIAAARAVMEDGKHVLLAGEGAEQFAFHQKRVKVEEVSPVYFWTLRRWQELLEEMKQEETPEKPAKGARRDDLPRRELGTVGAVALDREGNLAAGTSTGGLTNKRFGRVGDSPIIGAGTYADNQTCAVSCTGHGEVYIRYAVAHDVVSRMKYLGRGVEQATREVLDGLPKEGGGVGGLIALDGHGRYAWQYNTEGMYRGYVTEDGAIHVAIYEK